MKVDGEVTLKNAKVSSGGIGLTDASIAAALRCTGVRISGRDEGCGPAHVIRIHQDAGRSGPGLPGPRSCGTYAECARLTLLISPPRPGHAKTCSPTPRGRC